MVRWTDNFVIDFGTVTCLTFGVALSHSMRRSSAVSTARDFFPSKWL